MVSTPEGFAENSPMSHGPYLTIKKAYCKKSLRQFSQVLDVKQKTAIHRLGAAK